MKMVGRKSRGGWVRAIAAFGMMVGCALPSMARAEPFTVAAARQLRLANGLEVTLQEDRRQPLVALVVEYSCGWRDDPPGLEGLAHVVEHMTYRGSRHLAPFQGVELLQKAGLLHFSGTTHADFTRYEALVPRQALPLALFVESERMAFTLERFDQRSLAQETQVIRREMDARADPAMALRRLANNAYYDFEHRYAMPTRGYNLLAWAKLPHAQWFFQQGYRPDQARLVLVGDFETDHARTLIERYFGPVRNPAVKRVRAALPAPSGTTSRLYHRRRTNSERLVALWPAPHPGSRERAAAELGWRHVVRSLRSRLARERLATAVRLSVDDRELASALAIDVELAARGQHGQVEAQIAAVIAEARRLDWPSVLPRLKAEARLSESSVYESPIRTAREHLDWLRFRRRPFDLALRRAELDAVDAEAVRSSLALFTSERVVVAHMSGPRPGEQLPPHGRVAISPR